uniref:Uncharacterized protein n=1 Tax=Ditylenchus dipsaci TaxID=166011 RepID=A0A915CS50_9BILA
MISLKKLFLCFALFILIKALSNVPHCADECTYKLKIIVDISNDAETTKDLEEMCDVYAKYVRCSTINVSVLQTFAKKNTKATPKEQVDFYLRGIYANLKLSCDDTDTKIKLNKCSKGKKNCKKSLEDLKCIHPIIKSTCGSVGASLTLKSTKEFFQSFLEYGGIEKSELLSDCSELYNFVDKNKASVFL